MRQSKLLWVLPTFVVASSMSCSKKSTDESTTTNSDGSAKLESLASADQLGVSSALKVSVPTAYDKSKATTLGLTAGKRSQEACRMGDSVKQVVDSISQVGRFFCHIEVEKEKIKFGVKTTIKENGQEFGKIWIDNSGAASGNITLYMCEEGALKEKIAITGVKMGADGKPSGIKGTLHTKGSQDAHSWMQAVTFDKNFTGAYIEVSSKDKYSDSENGGSFARAVDMKLHDVASEVSKISLASKGTWGGQAFKDKGVGLGASGFGMALFSSEGAHEGNVFSWTHRSFFDDNGYVVAQTASDLLSATGSLYVKAADLPAYLADDFTPDAPIGWDCSGADAVVELNPESAAHQACEEGRENGEGSSCWGDDFEQSSMKE